MKINNGAMPLKQVRTSEDIDKQFRQVGDQYEQHFMREMVKQMRGTIQPGGLIPQSQGEKIFQEMLDDNYVEKWGKKGGIGLSDIIYNQLKEKYGPLMGLGNGIQKPVGPIKLDEKANANPMISQQGLKTQVIMPKEKGIVSEVKNPWSGKLVQDLKLDENTHSLEIEHGDGLKSRMTYRGTLTAAVGNDIQAGETLGWASEMSEKIFWTIEPNGQKKSKNTAE